MQLIVRLVSFSFLFITPAFHMFIFCICYFFVWWILYSQQ